MKCTVYSGTPEEWFEVAVLHEKAALKMISTELKTCAAIINIFHLIPAPWPKMIKPLTLKGENDLLIQVSY